MRTEFLSIVCLLGLLFGCKEAHEPVACSDKPTTKGLVSSWAAKSVAHLNGRTQVSYSINQDTKSITVPIGGESHILNAVPMPAKDVAIAKGLLEKVNKSISLNFVPEKPESKADVQIYTVCETRYNHDYGIVTTNKAGDITIMLLNTCSDLYKKQTGSFHVIFLHEFGHVLGLEHPFDVSDGDCMISEKPFGRGSPHRGQTLMAYENAPKPEPIEFYTAIDLETLREIWGPNKAE